MLRRSFIALTALSFAQRTALAQDKRADKGGSSEKTGEFLDFQSAVMQALRTASSVEAGAEQYMRDVLANARERLNVGAETLGEIPHDLAVDVIRFERNATTFILGVLEAAKTAEGRIEIKVTSVKQSLAKYCPFFPFC